MRTAEVIRKIREAARDAGLLFQTFERTNHTGIQVDRKRTTIGRHTETPNLMAEKIYKQLEEVLGEDWWR